MNTLPKYTSPQIHINAKFTIKTKTKTLKNAGNSNMVFMRKGVPYTYNQHENEPT
jgi:hypothetical protein